MKRPQVPDKVKRRHVIGVRVPALVKKDLERLVQYRGESLSTILRRFVIQGVRSELPPSWRGPTKPDSDSSKSPGGIPIDKVSDSQR
jgi:hypothetical protein